MRAATPLIVLAVTAILAPSASVAYAQQSTQTAPSAVQERQESCNAQASAQNLSGDRRKVFMSDCLTGSGSGSSTESSQQMLTRSCNTTANSRNLTGDARKSFMASCIKGQ